MSEIDQIAPLALALAGVPVGEGDLEVLSVVAQVFEPGVLALDAVDLAKLPLEGDLDPGRPPQRGDAR